MPSRDKISEVHILWRILVSRRTHKQQIFSIHVRCLTSRPVGHEGWDSDVLPSGTRVEKEISRLFHEEMDSECIQSLCLSKIHNKGT